MPRNSSGSYTSPPGDAAVPGTTISSVAYNGQNSDFAAEITNSLDRNGRGGMLANLPMGGNRITGLADPVNLQDGVTLNELKNYPLPATQMAPQPAGTVIANITGAAAAPAAVTFADLLAAAAPGVACVPGAISLFVTNQFSALPSSQVGMTASSAVLVNAAGTGVQLLGVSQEGSLLASGAGGLDVGAVAANTWYLVWLIYNPTTDTQAILFSLNWLMPALPSGYTFFARLGSCLTDGSSNLYRFYQRGNRFQWSVTPGTNTTRMMLLTGTTGSVTAPTWTAFGLPWSVGTASAVDLVLVNSGSSNCVGIVAPNASYGAAGTIPNPPPLQTNINSYNVVSKTIVFEQANTIFAALQSSVELFVAGFVDAINAC